MSSESALPSPESQRCSVCAPERSTAPPADACPFPAGRFPARSRPCCWVTPSHLLLSATFKEKINFILSSHCKLTCCREDQSPCAHLLAVITACQSPDRRRDADRGRAVHMAPLRAGTRVPVPCPCLPLTQHLSFQNIRPQEPGRAQPLGIKVFPRRGAQDAP